MKANSHLSREQRINLAMQNRKSDFALVLENLNEDQNIQAVLRTAEAFGVGLVCIIYSDKKPRLSGGAASGAAKWLNVEYFTSTKECITSLKKKGFLIVGALVNPDSEVLWEQDFSDKVAILVGNEVYGMSEEAQSLVDKNIYLPMIGLTESLNVSVSAGIFLYEVIRQKEKSI